MVAAVLGPTSRWSAVPAVIAVARADAPFTKDRGLDVSFEMDELRASTKRPTSDDTGKPTR